MDTMNSKYSVLAVAALAAVLIGTFVASSDAFALFNSNNGNGNGNHNGNGF